MLSVTDLQGLNIVVHDAEIERLVGSPHPTQNRPITWEDHDAMGISVVCLFDYVDMEYKVFMKDNLDELAKRLNSADMIVGFNVIDFDHRLYRANGVALKPESELRTYDILVESRKALGIKEGSPRPGGLRMNNHLLGTFGPESIKTADGADAPGMWQRGEIGKLVTYCISDVFREKRLFEHICAYSLVVTDTHGTKYVRHPLEVKEGLIYPNDAGTAPKDAERTTIKPVPGTADWVDEVFTYHAPTSDQITKYQRVRDNAKSFARVVFENTPRCADQTAAIRKLRECVHTANAAIALEGLV